MCTYYYVLSDSVIRVEVSGSESIGQIAKGHPKWQGLGKLSNEKVTGTSIGLV